ncbi:MAG: adenylyl-sulfate kinase [Cytophagales bacterium]|nr:MAG: adenylyl-sulfate kinase [Cytophagales bacterium]
MSTVLRAQKQTLLNQKAKMIWLFGLPSSGKSTLAQSLEARLFAEGFLTKILDGDELRAGLNQGLGFTAEQRTENLRRAAEVAKLFLETGVIVIAAFISPTEATRQLVQRIVGADDTCFVFVNASLKTCEARDVKGLYAKARRGEIQDFTGISSPFELPQQAVLEVRTDELNVEQCTQFIYNNVSQFIR